LRAVLFGSVGSHRQKRRAHDERERADDHLVPGLQEAFLPTPDSAVAGRTLPLNAGLNALRRTESGTRRIAALLALAARLA
jgi:hypothetical protein